MSWEGLNRRKFPRAKFPCLIKLIIEGKEGEALLTHTENISSGGACIIIKRSMDLFTSVNMELDLMDGEDHISCRGRVVWTVRRKATEAVKPSFYDIGIEYVDIKEPDRMRVERTVELLLKNLTKARI